MMRRTACLHALGFAVTTLASAAHAAPHAFVSVSGGTPASRAVRVIDLETMTITTTIGNVGDEPGRMVANADRSQIWLSSWRDTAQGFNEGQVHRIDTRTRQVVDSQVVGIRQNRTIALSPDESRVYTWKTESVDGVSSLGVAVLDATTLAEIVVVPITGSGCLQNASDIAVAPDGRIVAGGCPDGLRIVDPVTFTVTTGAVTPLPGTPIFGFSPDGGEVYVAATTPTVANGGTGIRAIDLETGTGTDFYWEVPFGSPNYPNGSTAARMIVVQRPDDPPGDPTVFFSYGSAFGNTPVAWARSSDLAGGIDPRQRRLIGRAAVGPSSSLGAEIDGNVGLGARLGGMIRLRFDPADPDLALAEDGSAVALEGVGTLTDIIVVAEPPDPLFADGFD